jgi:hypothetical protein
MRRLRECGSTECTDRSGDRERRKRCGHEREIRAKLLGAWKIPFATRLGNTRRRRLEALLAALAAHGVFPG